MESMHLVQHTMGKSIQDLPGAAQMGDAYPLEECNICSLSLFLS